MSVMYVKTFSSKHRCIGIELMVKKQGCIAVGFGIIALWIHAYC